jgi:hypothetical protein
MVGMVGMVGTVGMVDLFSVPIQPTPDVEKNHHL